MINVGIIGCGLAELLTFNLREANPTFIVPLPYSYRSPLPRKAETERRKC